jgi:thiol-disulfide isomerase/thioredoxin
MTRMLSGAAIAAALACLPPKDGSHNLFDGKLLAADVCDGGSAPAKLNFTLKDLTGAKVKLADFKGKVIALNFWATWCVPCKAEIPEFVDLQSRYGEQGLQFIGLSVDDPLSKLKPYVDQMKMNYPILQGRGNDAILDAFAPIGSLPVTVLISRDGTVCKKHVGPVTKELLEREIQSLIPDR